MGELAGNLGFDLIVVGLLLAIGLVNPVRWGFVHRGLWVALVGSWLIACRPRGPGGGSAPSSWQRSWPSSCRTWVPSPGSSSCRWSLVFSIIRVVMPVYAHDEVASVLARQNPSSSAQAFVGGLANHRVFSLARERARWAVDPASVSGGEMRRLHRDLWRQLRQLKVYYVHWERLGGERIGGSGDEVVLRCSGLTAGLLHDEKDRGPGMQPATTISTGLPTVGLRLGPFEITVRRQPDGTYRVVKAPESVPIQPLMAP